MNIDLSFLRSDHPDQPTSRLDFNCSLQAGWNTAFEVYLKLLSDAKTLDAATFAHHLVWLAAFTSILATKKPMSSAQLHQLWDAFFEHKLSPDIFVDQAAPVLDTAKKLLNQLLL
jgi:hypothetical protein